MSGDKFSRWAAATGGKVLLPRAQQAQSAPQPTPAHNWPWPQPVVQPAAKQPPPPMPASPVVAPTGHAHPRQLWFPAGSTTVETCAIVKHDAVDPYAQLISGVRDLSGDVDLSQGYDAMRMPGVPDGAAMEKWTSNAKRTYGGRDCDNNPELSRYTQHKYGAGSFKGGVSVVGGRGTFTKPTGG